MDIRTDFLVVSVLLISLLSFSVPLVSAASEEAVPLEVVEAEAALVLAYDSVSEAEEEGAHVSELLDKLSLGGKYLGEAYVAVRLGDSVNAVRLASLCVEAVDGVEVEAVLLRDEAARMKKEDFLVRVFGSVVGIFIVLVAGFVLWEIFKGRYHDRVLNSRPEVVSVEA